MLVRQLPDGCALSRARNGGVAWTTEHELLAAVFDVLRGGNWQRGGGKGPRPKPLRRPGAKTAKTIGTPVAIEEMRQILDTWDDPPAGAAPAPVKKPAKKKPATKRPRGGVAGGS